METPRNSEMSDEEETFVPFHWINICQVSSWTLDPSGGRFLREVKWR